MRTGLCSTRTGLRHAETEIEKWRAETGARNAPVQDPKPGNRPTETQGCRPKPPECGQFSHTPKSLRGDRTTNLGVGSSNLSGRAIPAANNPDGPIVDLD